MASWMRTKQPVLQNKPSQSAKQSQPLKSQSAQSAPAQLPASPSSDSSQQVLQLQRLVGNRAVQRLMQPAQADIQRQRPIGPQGGQVDSSLQSQINSARGGGRPLDKQVSAKIGGRLGADSHGVRVHTDAQSEAINRSLGAEAATVGNDIFFSPGAYRPGSPSGQKLLAHELTHVVQQGGAGNKVQTKLRVGPANDAYERQADQAAGYSSAAMAPGAFSQPTASTGLTIQRKMKFRVEDLEGYVSTKAAYKGKLGMGSTYSKIQKTLMKYWSAETSEERLVLLRVLVGLSEKWLKSVEGEKDSKSKDIEKKASIEKLLAAAQVELQDEEYRAKYANPDNSIFNALKEQMVGGNFGYARQAKKEIKKGEKTKDQLGVQTQAYLEQYKSLKSLGLTLSEISALYAYTGEQFLLMNPAMAGNKGWLKANMDKLGKRTSAEDLDKAMEVNQDIANYAGAGLDKLPPWKQDQTIFRGETLPQAEGDAMGPGVQKTYPHLVSTSLELMTPKAMITSNTSDERPYKVLYHITKTHKPGKDVGALAKSGTDEKEILFPAGTTFSVYKVLKENKANNYKEVEVSTH